MANVNFAALGKNFLTPLLISPIIAVAAGGIIYSAFRISARLARHQQGNVRLRGTETQIIPIARPDGLFTAEALPKLTFTADQPAVCQQRYSGSFLGINAARLVDALHFVSAGAVSFARGLNDTPKIAALLLVATALDIRWGLIAVAVAMAVGGVLNARKVANTMANKITEMNAGQGFAANLATALLVNTASYHGLPVSTTHVSVGSLVGIGMVTKQTKWKPVLGIVLSWVVTLPCAAVLGAIIYSLLRVR